ncbi:zinc-binding dehydrogenase [Agromyces aerolatus]|uniref:zinc-binding dehydrogenase n=1 Tax=Agromyces sp. LY-1074 TaxID=3074080 RepID=UPI0028559BBA|nr:MULTISPECIES: zinc-binding dehydrogenase [unclassified Agromyces]MDR5701609.1 zinc-binding dehydrogenase [Agromyces sp. LY-1074]MDR5706139.1 zinc-binding dehydrogenase [Agromyces sp. LY-1358]
MSSPTTPLVEAGTQAVFDMDSLALSVEAAPPPVAEPGGLIARVTLAGVCGSDVHRIAGHVHDAAGPVSFGHEAVGVVEALGDGLTADWGGVPVAVGDRIIWYAGSTPCGQCRGCRTTGEACDDRQWPLPASVPNAAGYRDVASLSRLVPFFRVDGPVTDEELVAFGCALPTAISGQRRLGLIEAGQTVVVQGAGPVGIAAAMVASLSPARHVIVIGAPAHRLELAREFGATVAIDLGATSAEERLARVHELTDGRGADVVIEAAGVADAFPEGVSLLARHGRYLLSGLYSGTREVAFNPVPITLKSARIIGNLGSRPEVGLQALRFVQANRDRFPFARVVTHRYDLADVAGALAAMRDGTAVKAVVTPGTAPEPAPSTLLREESE